MDSISTVTCAEFAAMALCYYPGPRFEPAASDDGIAVSVSGDLGRDDRAW